MTSISLVQQTSISNSANSGSLCCNVPINLGGIYVTRNDGNDGTSNGIYSCNQSGTNDLSLRVEMPSGKLVNYISYSGSLHLPGFVVTTSSSFRDLKSP